MHSDLTVTNGGLVQESGIAADLKVIPMIQSNLESDVLTLAGTQSNPLRGTRSCSD